MIIQLAAVVQGSHDYLTMKHWQTGCGILILEGMKTVMHAMPENAIQFLSEAFGKRIVKNEPVLFLCTGGSSAVVAAAVCKDLADRYGDKKGGLKWLFTVSLADERFGPEGHPESNLVKLVNLGLPMGKVSTIHLLKGSAVDNDAFSEAVRHFDAFLTDATEKKLAGKLHIAALLGIGSGNQTAGILPGSPVVNPEATGTHDITNLRWAAGYHSSILTRITITPDFFPMIDLAAVWIDPKETPDAASRLEEDLSPVDHPAQLLKKAAETIVFVT
jgi:6-phosphogluconolactonase/glucosamine-6-phosphate isomerase/deaminase